MKDSTIADLLAEPNSSKPLCETPGVAGKQQQQAVRLTVSKSRRHARKA